MKAAQRSWSREAKHDAMPELDDAYTRSVLEFRDVEKNLRDRCPGLVCLERIASPFDMDGRSVSRDQRWNWIRILLAGCRKLKLFVLCTIDCNFLMHAICIDTAGQCPRILHCAEKDPIELTKESLFLCCSTGDHSDLIGFGYLRRVVRLGSSAA